MRGAESAKRSEYDTESNGMKQKGQRSANPILDWTSYEVWLYSFANNLIINEAYKKGSQRVGCLCCPMGGSKADFFQYCNYKNEIDDFAQIIIDSNGRKHVDDIEYISNGGWNARKNGVNIKNINIVYKEQIEGDKLIIKVSDPKTNWHEWIKTLGDIHKDDMCFIIQAHELSTPFNLIEKSNGYEVQLPLEVTKTSPVFGKYFRQVFRKAAYCVACMACEANCKNNSISFENGLKISKCVKCRECHAIPLGCLAYHSLKMPTGDGKMKSINCFATHMQKPNGLKLYLTGKTNFSKKVKRI